MLPVAPFIQKVTFGQNYGQRKVAAESVKEIYYAHIKTSAKTRNMIRRKCSWIAKFYFYSKRCVMKKKWHSFMSLSTTKLCTGFTLLLLDIQMKGRRFKKSEQYCTRISS